MLQHTAPGISKIPSAGHTKEFVTGQKPGLIFPWVVVVGDVVDWVLMGDKVVVVEVVESGPIVVVLVGVVAIDLNESMN